MTDGFCTPQVWAVLVARACEVNEYAAPETQAHAPRVSGTPAGEDSPGTDFNRRGSWSESGLFDAGWKWERQTGTGEVGLIRRPDKDHGVSASIGTITSKQNGWPLFWCWSTSAPDFIAEKPYTRFAVFAILKHGGNFSDAAKELAHMGYGKPFPEVPGVVFGETPKDGTESGRDPNRIFLWMSELKHREENDKWIWKGFISRGGVTMLSSLWKAGKSTLLSHLLRAFDGRTAEFLGLPIVPSRVLVVSEEHEEMWAERRDELGIGDHVGMICRPFKSRPSPAQWAEFIGQLVAAVKKEAFDMVVMDTISKLWPVREENDANAVEDALMPLWNITNGGSGLTLVHHNRKSDGKEFTGARGSGGLPAFCETLMEFRRNSENAKDSKRVMTAIGRYKETPTKWLIELTPSGYVGHGNPDEMTTTQKRDVGYGNPEPAGGWQDWLFQNMPHTDATAKTVDDIQTDIGNSDGRGGKGIRRQDVIDYLDERISKGYFLKVGTGKKNNPYRYYKPNAVPKIVFRPPVMYVGTESGTESDADSE